MVISAASRAAAKIIRAAKMKANQKVYRLRPEVKAREKARRSTPEYKA